MKQLSIFLMAVFLASDMAAMADSEVPRPIRLINLDTPVTLGRGVLSFLGDVRIFGAQEDVTYGTLQLGYGLHDDFDMMLRGSLAETKGFAGPGFTIRHGGTDVELLGKWRPRSYPHAAFTLGLSAPDTPAQNSVYLTAQALYQRPLGSHVVAHFAAKGVFVKDDPIVGIGGGGSLRLSDTLQLVADITGIVSGNNTRSVFTGGKMRREVWGFALRFRPHSNSNDLTVDVGVTNGTGGTTGFSLTPGLSGSAAVYVSLACRR